MVVLEKVDYSPEHFPVSVGFGINVIKEQNDLAEV